MSGAYVTARMFSKCKREKKKEKNNFNLFFYECPAIQPVSSASEEDGSPQEMVCRSCSVTFLYSQFWDLPFQNVFSFNLFLSPCWYFGIWPCRISCFPEWCMFLRFKTRISSVPPLLTLSDIQQFYSPVAKPPICCLSNTLNSNWL